MRTVDADGIVTGGVCLGCSGAGTILNGGDPKLRADDYCGHCGCRSVIYPTPGTSTVGVRAAADAYLKETGMKLEAISVGPLVFADLVSASDPKCVVWITGSIGVDYAYSVMIDGIEVTP